MRILGIDVAECCPTGQRRSVDGGGPAAAVKAVVGDIGGVGPAGGTLGIAGQCPAIADTQGGMMTYRPNYRPNYDDAERDDTDRRERQERQQSEGGLAEDEDSSEREIAEHDRQERELVSRPLEDNEAHAAGQVCARCGVVVTVSQDVRRRADGRWVHEVCPP